VISTCKYLNVGVGHFGVDDLAQLPVLAVVGLDLNVVA
jgi:hypothetical protein